jgi:hypothetical protein
MPSNNDIFKNVSKSYLKSMIFSFHKKTNGDVQFHLIFLVRFPRGKTVDFILGVRLGYFAAFRRILKYFSVILSILLLFEALVMPFYRT